VPGSNGGPPVVVTGISRSGTSWVGKMLEAGGDLVYINEPLNPEHPPGHSPGILRARVDHGYQYITEQNEREYLRPFQEMFRLRYHVVAELRQNRSPYDLARMVKYASSFVAGRLRRQRPLLDDPFALLAAEWLARRLDCQVIILARHPAAILSSWRRLGWTTDLSELLGQPLLIRDWLEPARRELEAVAAAPDDLAGRVSLLWRALYSIATEFQRRTPGIQVVRYEDLALRPLPEFRRLYEWLGLRLSGEVERTIVRATSGGNVGKGHGWSLTRRGLSKTAFRPLDSKAQASSWRRSLSAEEIARVMSLAGEVARRWYPAGDLEQPAAERR
jgi:Sulfotransferase domain